MTLAARDHHVAPPPRTDPVRVSLHLSPMVRAGLSALLASWPDRVEVLAHDDRARAQVDVFDPEGRHQRPADDVPRLALTWDPSPEAAIRARDLGAVLVVPLSAGADGLLRTIEQVHRRRTARAAPADELSPRERDVVRGICDGLSNAEIADRLDLSVNSVKTYIRTAYRKMDVRSRSQAVLWGVGRRC